MKKTLFSVLICIFLAGALGAESLWVPGELLVKSTQRLDIKGKNTGLQSFDSFLNSFGVKSVEPMRGMPSEKYYRVKLSQMPDLTSLKTMSFDGIEYIEPNYIRKMHVSPNDPYFGRQLHHLCNIPQAWNHSTGSRQIVVGVVDSGLLLNHPDITPNLYINTKEIADNGIDDDNNGYIDDWCGWDFVHAPEMADVALGDYLDPDNDVTDENFHGTHVSGIIGAAGNNGIGISGVCWNVSIMPLRAGFRTTTEGYLQDDNAAEAIVYAADNGCHVVNMSWGDPAYSAVIADACDYAYNKGVILVASSGNTPGPNMSYPARLASVISVGSVNSAKVLSSFSSYGHDLDLVAPGEMILSTYKDSGEDMYMELSGTSMSAPYVTGSIALLLALEPGLSPAEVRARLLSSTDDINDAGYDIKTGHGLLNTQKLLVSSSPPFVQITSPLDQSGASSTVQILGSVYGEDFSHYTLMYRSITNPAMSEWRDAREHSTLPQYFTEEVHNGVLGEFHIPDSFPEGSYMLRLQYQKKKHNQMKYNYYITINVDRSAPILREEKLSAFSRYETARLQNYVSAVFDEPVMAELEIFGQNGYRNTMYGSFQDSLQVWLLPQDTPVGQISIRISGTNQANISYQSPIFEDFMEIRYQNVPTWGFSHREIGKARVPLNSWADFDGNGKLEYVAMDIPISGYGQIYSYEPHNGVHRQSHWFGDTGWPLDIGDTTGFGLDLLLIKSDTALLWHTPSGEDYPDKNMAIWNSPGVTGGCLADFDGNGTTDIAVVRNLPTERVIELYNRSSSGGYIPRYTLRNTTATYTRNNFVPTVIVEDFDNNGQKEVLTADTDGDVMIFSLTGGQNAVQSWHTRLPVTNTYQVASGDFNGDGQKDFIVGGYNTHLLDINQNFWYFEAFTAKEGGGFRSMGTIMFNNVISQNTILVADLDGDGIDEIIMALSPNLYIVKYQEGEFKPVFVGESFNNYRLAHWKDEADKSWIIANYSVSADSLICVEWGMDEPFTGPDAPLNFIATPINESAVKLSWVPMDADYYRIYRENEAGETSMIDGVLGEDYIDGDLQENHKYRYNITAVNSAFSPPESMPGFWQEAIPKQAPIVERIEMAGKNELRVYYNQEISYRYLSPGHYLLNHGMGKPQSVNNIAQSHGVQLRFKMEFTDPGTDYILSIDGIYGSTGVPMQVQNYAFSYTADIDPPRIVGTEILDSKKQLLISFDEEIMQAEAQYLPNYTLSCPANDPDNRITHVEANAQSVLLSFSHPLRYSDQAYYVRVENVQDLFGNVISPQHNLARFALREFSSLKHVKCYPNPVHHAMDSEVVFLNFPANKQGEISIFSASGNLVYKSKIGPFLPESNQISYRWNLKNSSGRRVSSGVYYYIIEMNQERVRGKIAVIN